MSGQVTRVPFPVGFSLVTVRHLTVVYGHCTNELSRICVFSVMFDVSVLELKENTCCHQDNLFIRKVRRLYTFVE